MSTDQDHAEPMLPDAPDAPAETPYEVGFRTARSQAPYDVASIPPALRRAYSRGFTRGCVERARTQREGAR